MANFLLSSHNLLLPFFQQRVPSNVIVEEQEAPGQDRRTAVTEKSEEAQVCSQFSQNLDLPPSSPAPAIEAAAPAGHQATPETSGRSFGAAYAAAYQYGGGFAAAASNSHPAFAAPARGLGLSVHQSYGAATAFQGRQTLPGFVPRPALTGTDYEAYLAEAHEQYRANDFSRALQICQLLHTADASRTDVLLLLGAVYYQLGDYQQCVLCNERCILLDPLMAEAHANLANALQQQGNFDGAIIYYQAALRLKPSFTDAYNNLASALVQKGYIGEAMSCYKTALQFNPNLVDVHNNMGDLWRAQGLVGRTHAHRAYADALRVSPGYAPALRGLGDLFREAGEHTKAIPHYQEAVRQRPGYPDAYTGMGVSLKELKRLEEAEACFCEVVRLRPHCALSLGNLAAVLYEQGRLNEAIAAYQQALALDPGFLEAYNNLGNALREAGRPADALGMYLVCLQLQLARPGAAALAAGIGGVGLGGAAAAALRGAYAMSPALLAVAQAQRLSVAYNNLGGVLKMLGRAQEAIACYEHVALLQPDSPEAHANLASACKDASRLEEAIHAYRKALQLRPDFPEAFANLVHSLQSVCEWRDRSALFQRLQAEVRRDLAAGRLPPVQPFHAMAYPFPALLALAISAKYAEYCASTASRLGLPKLAHPPARPLGPGERLRVAYVSSDFGNHPLSHLMGSVFGLHDRSRVEVFCYALSPSDGSEWRQRIEREAEHFLDVNAWSVGEIVARISADRIHVAVNLNGYTKGARNEIFALLPAPVQASYMGFPATTGAAFLPYLITDKVVAPESCRHCYSEHLALMPHCYFVNDYKAAHMDVLQEPLPSRAEVGLPDDCIIYSCSNQLYKYDPETFATWCNILRRVPNSVLWLLRFPPLGEPRIHAEAAAHGVDPARIIFTDVAAKPIHIRRSGLADVFLDTPLCNAHTTGCDVLWGGCPMVTLPLERMASRVAASLCAATGLGAEMVVASQAEYEERAVELGLNHEKRLALRRRLQEARLTCPLFDTDGWVRDLERVYLRMWAIHCSGKGPHTFEV